jgi:hypothetical protein
LTPAEIDPVPAKAILDVPTPPAITIATADDLPWIYHLQRKFAHALGWIPKAGMQQPIDNGRILLAHENDAPAGFIYHKQLHGEPHIRSIVQAAVAMDAQRRHHGLAVLDKIRLNSSEDVIQCWCAEELEANQFWHAAGFVPIAIRDPENVRGRRLILWRQPLTAIGKTLLTDTPKRVGPTAAKPKKLVMLTAEQTVAITQETPQDLQAALAKIQIAHPTTSLELNVQELLHLYTTAKTHPKLQHVAAEIAEAIAEQLAATSPTVTVPRRP